MNVHPERPSGRWPVRLVRRFVAPAARVPGLEQSAGERARVDTSKWAGAAPIRFGLVTTASVAVVGVLAGLIPSGLSLGARIVAGVVGACVGFLLPVAALFVLARLTATRRQRDEARDEVRRLTRPTDVAELARHFSEWVEAKSASLPRHGLRKIPSIFETDSEAWTAYEKREDEIDRIHAQARTEYHERFRGQVVDVLGDDARSPNSINDLGRLAERLIEAAEIKRRADLVAGAGARLVGPRHRSLLEAMLDRFQLAVLNEQAMDYGDAPGGEPQNQSSFDAHFKSLRPDVVGWHGAVHRLVDASQELRDFIAREVPGCGFTEPDYNGGTVEECFTEVSVRRALGREGNEPKEIHLRCVGDSTTPEGGQRWSAYLHSGTRELKVAELDYDIAELSEDGTEGLNEIIAGMDQDLQACFDAIQRSDAAAGVTEAHDALLALKQPLLDRFRPLKVAFEPVFSEDCTYCLAELGL
jgi:hypothetical protein